MKNILFPLRKFFPHYTKRTRLSLILTLMSIAIFTTISLMTINILSQPALSQSAEIIAVKTPNFGRYFQEIGRSGSILIYDSQNNRYYEHHPQRNITPLGPASTFKIFNSLVALETGVIADDVAILTWDGIKRDLDVWNHDTNLGEAFKNSTVWFYQVLARRIGYERMQSFINKVGYGNGKIGTDAEIDQFWLKGPLQITPKQQIEFLQRLYKGDLPFSPRTMNLVKDIMIREQTPDYILRAKTGWLQSKKPQLGWFVGYLEQNKNVYFFATTLDILTPEDAPARIEITRKCLKDLGLLNTI